MTRSHSMSRDASSLLGLHQAVIEQSRRYAFESDLKWNPFLLPICQGALGSLAPK